MVSGSLRLLTLPCCRKLPVLLWFNLDFNLMVCFFAWNVWNQNTVHCLMKLPTFVILLHLFLRLYVRSKLRIGPNILWFSAVVDSWHILTGWKNMYVANRNNLEFVRNLLSVLQDAPAGNPVVVSCGTSVFNKTISHSDVVFAFALLQNNTWFVLWLQLWIKPGVQLPGFEPTTLCLRC